MNDSGRAARQYDDSIFSNDQTGQRIAIVRHILDTPYGRSYLGEIIGQLGIRRTDAVNQLLYLGCRDVLFSFDETTVLEDPLRTVPIRYYAVNAPYQWLGGSKGKLVEDSLHRHNAFGRIKDADFRTALIKYEKFYRECLAVFDNHEAYKLARRLGLQKKEQALKILA